MRMDAEEAAKGFAQAEKDLQAKAEETALAGGKGVVEAASKEAEPEAESEADDQD